MNIFQWLLSLFTRRGQALLMYRRGMWQANKQNSAGAIEAYTAAIKTPDAPPDVKAMALYNRALIHAAGEDQATALEDLNEVLAMAEAPSQIKTEARRKVERMKRQSDKNELADSPPSQPKAAHLKNPQSLVKE